MELRTWGLQSLQSGVFSAFYGEQQKKKYIFFVVRKDIACVQMPSPLKKGGGDNLSLLDFFWGEGGVCTQLHNFINTYHTLEEKIHKNSQNRGLKWPKVSKKKDVKNLQE